MSSAAKATTLEYALGNLRDETNIIEHRLDIDWLKSVIVVDDPEITAAALRIYRALHRIHHRTLQITLETNSNLERLATSNGASS